MSEPQFSPEVVAWLQEGWDPGFSVWGPDVHEGNPREWHVVDAECEVIAVCDSPEEADLVRRAVDFYNDEMERQRWAAVQAADP